MNKNNEKIKKENKKALPKFLIAILIAAAAGGVFGFFSAFIGHSELSQSALSAIQRFFITMSPYISLAAILFLLLPSYAMYRKAKAISLSWNGEDEDLPEEIDKQLNVGLILLSICMIINFFAISCVICFNLGLGGSVIVLFSFILSMVLLTVLQQKFIDLNRRLNPEKQGSIYDMKFQEKWYKSCDEAEKQLIGEAAYRSFVITSNCCMILWCLTIFTHIAFNTGIMPPATVLLIFGISQLSYCHSAMKLSKVK